MPLIDDWAVPSQMASTSASDGAPSGAVVCATASRARSSKPLSQCSAKGVQPIATIATWSLIPCEPISATPDEPALPEVVVDAVGGPEAPEHHLHLRTDLHLALVDVGQLHREAGAVGEVDHGEDHRRARRPRQLVDGEGGDGADGVGDGAGLLGDEAQLPVP